MASRSKTSEEWITFLLTLIDHTKDFKPDWEGFAQNTGLYKRGKFVPAIDRLANADILGVWSYSQQAYNGLRKKYADGQFATATGGNVNGGSEGTVPKTPGARVNKSSKEAAKRTEADDDARDDDGAEDVKPKINKKRKTGSSASAMKTERTSTATDDSDEGEDHKIVEVKDADVLQSIEKKEKNYKKAKTMSV